MAQDIGTDRSIAAPAVTLLGSNLADTVLAAVTAAIDLGNPTPNGLGFEVKLDCQAGASDIAILYASWSQDNSDFTDTYNKKRVAIIQCNAGTVVLEVGEFRVEGRYVKFWLENQAGGAINSLNTSLSLWDIFGDIA